MQGCGPRRKRDPFRQSLQTYCKNPGENIKSVCRHFAEDVLVPERIALRMDVPF